MGARFRRRVLAATVALAALVPSAITHPAGGQTPPPTTATPVVRIPFPRDDGTLTPYTFQLGYPLMTLVYDTLLWRDPKGAAQPWLARAVETSPDARRFTVRLNPGVTWHDGRPLTADDVRFTFGYVGAHANPRFTPEVANVASVTVPDPATVVVTTRQPAPGFADQTLADLPILPAHLWQGLGAGQDSPPGLPVGSGPYRLVERPAGGYRFEANASYFKGAPTVAQISVPIISEIGATLSAFQRGEVDMVPLRLGPENIRTVDGPGVKVARAAGYAGVQLAFNMRRAPFNDPAVRQTVAKGLDLGAIAEAVGDSVPAEKGMLHPDSAWASGSTLKVTDPAGAKADLARLTEPVEVLSADNDPVLLAAARQVANALSDAGVRATATPRPVAELNRVLGLGAAPGRPPVPDFTLAVTSLDPAASYDPDYLARLFGSATLTTSGYASPAFDRIAQRVATTVDPTARRAATAEELRLLAADLPALPLFFPNGAFAYNPSVYDGWRYIRGVGVLDKQSFLPGDRTADTPVTAPPPQPEAASAPAKTSGGGLPPWLVPLGFVVAALALMGAAVVRSRR